MIINIKKGYKLILENKIGEGIYRAYCKYITTSHSVARSLGWKKSGNVDSYINTFEKLGYLKRVSAKEYDIYNPKLKRWETTNFLNSRYKIFQATAKSFIEYLKGEYPDLIMNEGAENLIQFMFDNIMKNQFLGKLNPLRELEKFLRIYYSLILGGELDDLNALTVKNKSLVPIYHILIKEKEVRDLEDLKEILNKIKNLNFSAIHRVKAGLDFQPLEDAKLIDFPFRLEPTHKLILMFVILYVNMHLFWVKDKDCEIWEKSFLKEFLFSEHQNRALELRSFLEIFPKERHNIGVQKRTHKK